MSRETCARCSHQTEGCPRCGVTDLYLGAAINGKPYCHLDKPGPTCYERTSLVGSVWPMELP